VKAYVLVGAVLATVASAATTAGWWPAGAVCAAASAVAFVLAQAPRTGGAR
jgi:hypothetical protein